MNWWCLGGCANECKRNAIKITAKEEQTHVRKHRWKQATLNNSLHETVNHETWNEQRKNGKENVQKHINRNFSFLRVADTSRAGRTLAVVYDVQLPFSGAPLCARSFSLSVVSLSVPLCVCLSICLSVCLSVCLSSCLFVCLSVFCLSVCLSVCMSVCLSVCLQVYLSLSVCALRGTSLSLSLSLSTSLIFSPSLVSLTHSL